MADSANAVPHPMYAGPIQEATRSGDQERMRRVEQQASQHLQEVEAALQQLRSALGNS